MADVVVVGAGIVGASVAYHAATAGADVVVLDSSLPACGVTGASFAWIGGPGGRDAEDRSSLLRRAALKDWGRLERQVPDVQVRWTGSLAWGEEALRDVDALGPDEWLVDGAEVRRLEPNLRLPPERAVFKSTDGAVDPVAVTEALLAAARSAGADVRVGESVTRLIVTNSFLTGIDTPTESIGAPRVVLAAGVGTSLLCAPLGIRVPAVSSPALLLRFSAPPGLIRTLVTHPQQARQAADGNVLVAWDYAGETTQGELRRTARDSARRLAATFIGGEDARLIDVRVGQRPMPADGLPIIGRLRRPAGIYLAVMHSGVTLAPSVGRLVAAELLDQVQSEELTGLRADRFPGWDRGSEPFR